MAGSHEIDTQFGYSVRDLVTSITHSVNGGGSLSSFTYGYDNAAHLTNSTATNSTGPWETLAYTNDPIGQLTRVTGSHTETYTYDYNGNRTSANGTNYGAPSQGNRLTSDGVYTYAYDAEGNETIRTSISDPSKVTTYTWDYRNRLTRVQSSDGGTVDDQFTYDVVNGRIGKRIGAGTPTWTAYDGTNPYADFNGTTLSNRYLYGNVVDQLFARVDPSGNTAWYLTDRLGSVRQIVSNTGGITYQVAFDAYGNILPGESGTGDRFKFTGREWDSEIGLQYNRARYYDPHIGRWLSQDPLGFGARDPNLYRYVFNSPTNGADPSGEVVHFIVIGIIVGAIWLATPSSTQDVNEGIHHPPVFDPPGAVIGACIGGLAAWAAEAAVGWLLSPCFVAGTLVSTESGLKPIQTIEANELVWAYDFRTCEWRLSPVVRPLQHQYDGDFVTIIIDGETIEATGNHPFWVMRGAGLARRPKPQHVGAQEPGSQIEGRWVDARDLQVGDQLVHQSGRISEVFSLSVCTSRATVYNLEVHGLHTYAVGTGCFLVHNRKEDIQQIRDVAQQNNIDPREFGDFVEEMKQDMDGVDPRGTLTWEQLQDLARQFTDLWDL